MPPRNSRIPELDGIRGCAILMVLVWHYIPCQIHSRPPGSLGAAIARLLSLTHSGVDLFFVLSGFLITGILIENRRSTNYFSVFYARRAFRIFPLYFLLLALFAAAVHLGFDSPWLLDKPFPLWSYATFTQNILMGMRGDFGPNWLGITWSLAVEEQFYFFIPVMVWLMPRRPFVLLTISLIFAAPMLRVFRGGMASYVGTPWRGDSLLMGALLAVAVRDERVANLIRSNVAILYATFGGLLAGAVILTLRPLAFGSVDHTWMALLYGAFLLLALQRTLVAKAMASKFLQWTGAMSYGLYMFHQAAAGIIHATFGNGTPSLDSRLGCVLTVLSLLLTVGATIVSYHCFEKPLLAFGHRWKYQRREGCPANISVEMLKV